jgi:hypothetical protein
MKYALAASSLLLVLGVIIFPGKSLSGDDSAHVAEAGDDPWMAAVRSGRFWSSGSGSSNSFQSGTYSRRRSSSSAESEHPRRSRFSRRSLERFEARPSDRWERGFGGSGTYRTVCVRLCDGYYWPISFATVSGQFDRDEQICQRSCSVPSRLYTYSNPGGEPEQMTDLKGEPYSKLATAFLYRNEYVQDCKCGPHPWEQDALDRHRLYALEARHRKGDKRVASEIAALRAAMAARQRNAKLTGTVKSTGSGGGVVQAPGEKPTPASQVTTAPVKSSPGQPPLVTGSEIPSKQGASATSDSPKASH